MTEEQQDLFLSEWLVDGYEQGLGKTEYGVLLSALGRLNPRARYKTAWKIFEVWGSLQPPREAAAAPPEMLTAMMISAFALNRVDLALVICLCFSALLRVGEALQLRWRDVFFSSGVLTLCLGQTKTGMEQKVVVTNGVVFQWLARYAATCGHLGPEARVFQLSYSSVLRWVKKLSCLLGGQDMNLTTHSFRRSGASELSRRGVPLADICLFGRWLSDRSARLYIRKGEVAVLRSTNGVSEEVRQRWAKWCQLTPFVWTLHKAISQSGLVRPTLYKVTEDSFGRLERAVFLLFG